MIKSEQIEALVLRQRDLLANTETVYVVPSEDVTIGSGDRLRIERNAHGRDKVYVEVETNNEGV